MKVIPPELLMRILMKRLWEEKPMKVIALELGISEGKARRYFHRGMFRIQKSVGTHQISGRPVKF